ncbi:MAG TPA: hypothetical protein VM013_04540 [Dehalococcoidia bacterium]|nr:hypothetical protein [Dehalococcoidia bacterium]
MPNALARLLGAMLGMSPKKAKRPAARTPAQPEAVPVEQEVESPMPEMNALPPEGPEETPLEEETAGSMEQKETPASEATRRAADILAKALSDAEALLVSAAPEPASKGPPPEEEATPPEPPPPPPPDALELTQDLLRTLTEHFDRALDRMADERRILIDETQSAGRSAHEQTERALDRMEQDRRDLAEQITTLARALERLEHRLDDLSRAVLESRRAPTTVAIEEEAPPEEETEPAFAPNGEGLTLVISAVPGFQGLMEVQRALTRIPAIEGASVERYFDGEARIVLTLREPITAARLLETLTQATGQHLQLEESRPEAMRMRVRFLSAAT